MGVNKCKAKKRSGEPCKNNPIKNSEYCFSHSFGRLKKVPWFLNAKSFIIFTIVLPTLFFLIQIKFSNDSTNQINEIKQSFENLPAVDEEELYDIAIFQEKFQEIKSYFDKSIETKSGKLAISYYFRGNTNLILNDFNASIRDYQKSIELDSTDDRVFNNLGVALNQIGKYELSLKSYKKAIELDPENDIHYRNAARRLLCSKKLNECKLLIDKALTLNRHNIYNINIAAIVRYELGYSQKAMELFTEATEKFPQNPTTYHNLGKYYLQTGDTLMAIIKYKEAIENDSLHTKSYNALAKIFKVSGKIEESLKYYELASTLFPQTSSDIYYNYGNALKSLQRYDEAVEKYKKAIEIDPNDAEAYNNWGTTLRALGEPRAAITKYQRAAEIDSTDANLYYNWGNALRDLGLDKEAIHKYRKFLRFSVGRYPERESRITSLINESE